MKRDILILGVAWALAMPAFAQAPPQTKPPAAPRAEQNSPDTCANATTGQGGDIEKRPAHPAAGLAGRQSAPATEMTAAGSPASWPPGGLLDSFCRGSLYPPIPGPSAGFGGGVAQLVRAAES